MRTEEERRQFILLRVQGWSINKIAKHINVPRATVWRWDHEERDMLQVLKAVRFEELQEKFVPTYEEELEQLTAYRDRIRKALENHDFSTMKPEFLLQMDLQISSRLAKFRVNVGIHSVADSEPASIPGCVSRTEVPYTGVEPDDDSTVAPPADPNGSAEQPSAQVHQPSTINHQPSENGPFRDKTPPGSKRDNSESATSDEKNGPVPISELVKLASDFGAKLQSMKPNGNGSPPPPRRRTRGSINHQHSTINQSATLNPQPSTDQTLVTTDH